MPVSFYSMWTNPLRICCLSSIAGRNQSLFFSVFVTADNQQWHNLQSPLSWSQTTASDWLVLNRAVSATSSGIFCKLSVSMLIIWLINKICAPTFTSSDWSTSVFVMMQHASKIYASEGKTEIKSWEHKLIN